MDTELLLDFLSEYSIVVGNTAYPPVIFIWVTFFLLVIFLVRIINWKLIDKTRTFKQTCIFASRQLPCFLFAVIISFTLTCIFGNNNNKILNGFICPAIGYISSILFDEKFLSQAMKRYRSNALIESGDKKDDDKEEKKEPTPTNIIVNVDNNAEKETDHEHSLDMNNVDEYLKKPSGKDYITDDDTTSAEFGEIVQNKINKLINARYVGAIEVLKIHEELKNQTKMLAAICETLKDERKIELEKLIYDCLLQGYATPEQNKLITSKYHNYRDLGGNGEIQELYEKHYLLLPIKNPKPHMNNGDFLNQL